MDAGAWMCSCQPMIIKSLGLGTVMNILPLIVASHPIIRVPQPSSSKGDQRVHLLSNGPD